VVSKFVCCPRTGVLGVRKTCIPQFVADDSLVELAGSETDSDFNVLRQQTKKEAESGFSALRALASIVAVQRQQIGSAPRIVVMRLAHGRRFRHGLRPNS